MTNRVQFLTVVLDDEIRDEDAEAVMAAIRMVKHVADVGTCGANRFEWGWRATKGAELFGELVEVLKRHLLNQPITTERRL